MLKKYLNHTLYAAAFLSFATACEPEIERDLPNYEESRGEADFSVYVALGNSLTAGYADNALFREGQENSYPAIIAEKLEYVTPEFEFNQPLMPEGNGVGFLGSTAIGRLSLTSISPLTLSPTTPSSGWEAPVSGPVHNLGVPGAKVGHLLAPGLGNPSLGAGNFNPYFARFASSTSTSVVEQAIALNPTFFTLWIGNNDVLGYALSGGEGTITPVPEFRQYYRAIVQSLVGARPEIEGAVANIPDVSEIPYVSTIVYNQLVLTAEQAAQANAAYSEMIDPNIQSAATYGVIASVVTESALRQNIIPGVARGIVKQQVAQSAPCNASPNPAECAEQVIQSGAMDAQIEGLRAQLDENYFLPANERDPELAGAYAVIDTQLEANQDAINTNIEQTIAAYEAEQLPAENMAALSTAIDSVFNAQLTQLKGAGFYPQFSEGPNAFVIEDDNPANPLGIRHMREGEKMLLAAQAEGELTPQTAALPKADGLILDLGELAQINEAIAAYNTIIQEVAQENTFALVDMNGFFDEVADSDGLTMDGTTFTAEFISGNAFSLDGVHLTQKGYALVAKRFINKINEYYKASIPEPNLRNYPAVALP